jgi:hypothetical protein
VELGWLERAVAVLVEDLDELRRWEAAGERGKR